VTVDVWRRVVVAIREMTTLLLRERLLYFPLLPLTTNWRAIHQLAATAHLRQLAENIQRAASGNGPGGGNEEFDLFAPCCTFSV